MSLFRKTDTVTYKNYKPHTNCFNSLLFLHLLQDCFVEIITYTCNANDIALQTESHQSTSWKPEPDLGLLQHPRWSAL